jgi:hypothetical protein
MDPNAGVVPMSRSFLSMLMCGSVLVLAACATPPQDPNAVSYSLQQQERSAPENSWQVVAADTWREVAQRLAAGGYPQTQISIEPPVQQTAFTQAMDNFLFTEAVDHGVAVAQNAPFTITYDTQIIHHMPDDGVTAPLLTPGTVGASASEDGGADSSTQLVLNVSVTDGNTVRIRESRIFNIADSDMGLYQSGHADKTVAELSNEPLVSSNWYADNPHDVLPVAMHEDNQFAVMVDSAHGPVHTLNEASTVAAQHCATLGMNQAKYVSQGFPTNQRDEIRVTYECM